MTATNMYSNFGGKWCITPLIILIIIQQYHLIGVGYLQRLCCYDYH